MTETIRKNLNRNVAVEGDKVEASGVVFETGFVLTVCHAIEVDSKIKVNGIEAEIVFASPKDDLLLLACPTIQVERLPLAEAQVTEQVYYVGNPGSLKNAVIFGRVVAENGMLYCDTAVQMGASGGGLYNMNGDLCGLVVAMKQACHKHDHLGSTFTVAIPVRVIAPFLNQALFVAGAIQDAMRRQYETQVS
ncbi:serine protease [Candidatus Dojkabacteria bacterium]|jgi:S1-C subfamily serine protease|nr:serine protease [Candidatus Dojkabacteria bacterium]